MPWLARTAGPPPRHGGSWPAQRRLTAAPTCWYRRPLVLISTNSSLLKLQQAQVVSFLAQLAQKGLQLLGPLGNAFLARR